MRFDKDFIGSKPWREVRRNYLMLHPYCEVAGCGHSAVQVDHIVARAQGGRHFDPRGLQALCASHHSQKTVAVDGGFGRRPVGNYQPVAFGCDDTGMPKNPKHHWHQ